MLSTLSEKTCGSGNEGWLELSGLILKTLKTFYSVWLYISVLELFRIIYREVKIHF
jgi:hypothetical protein